jgi:hypothetical protein
MRKKMTAADRQRRTSCVKWPWPSVGDLIAFWYGHTVERDVEGRCRSRFDRTGIFLGWTIEKELTHDEKYCVVLRDGDIRRYGTIGMSFHIRTMARLADAR